MKIAGADSETQPEQGVTDGMGMSIAAAILAFVGIAVMLVAAYLGGDMVFGKGAGVNHTAWEAAPESYESVLPVDQLPDHTLRRVTVADVPVILLKANET